MAYSLRSGENPMIISANDLKDPARIVTSPAVAHAVLQAAEMRAEPLRGSGHEFRCIFQRLRPSLRIHRSAYAVRIWTMDREGNGR